MRFITLKEKQNTKKLRQHEKKEIELPPKPYLFDL
jgi:hypothetical protein